MNFGALAGKEGDGAVYTHRFFSRTTRGFAAVIDERTNDIEIEKDFELVPVTGADCGGGANKWGGRSAPRAAASAPGSVSTTAAATATCGIGICRRRQADNTAGWP